MVNLAGPASENKRGDPIKAAQWEQGRRGCHCTSSRAAAYDRGMKPARDNSFRKLSSPQAKSDRAVQGKALKVIIAMYGVRAPVPIQQIEVLERQGG